MSLNSQQIQKLYASLKGYARWVCANDDDLAEELIQHTIVKQLEQNHENMDFDNVKHWCKRVLKNRFIDVQRKHRESQFDAERPEDENFADETTVRWRVGLYGKRAGKSGFDMMPKGETNAFMRLLYNDCMGQLKPEYREVMNENILGGKTTAEIAEDTGTPQNTILTWLTKAKLQFRGCIEGAA